MTDEAKFQFYLNRQGVRGKKGEKGDTGFSPTVEVNTNTAAEYTLKITNEDGEFVTDNLRGSAVEDRGGTYMRYDTETQEMYAGNPDSAGTNQEGTVILADQNSIEQISDATVLTPEGFVDNLKTFLKSSDNSVSITQDENDSKTDLKVDVSGIEGDISGLDSRITDCESAIDTIENTTIPAVQRDIDQLETDISNKVDKVAGKGLSTNDFTDAEEEKLMHAVVDSDLADVAFTGDYDDLTNKPTIPVIPANNLTGDSVDGTSIVYDSTTGKISATAQTPDLSNYVTKNTAQEINNTKTFLGNSLQVGDGNDSDIVASYDSTIYPTTTLNFSRVAGTVLGSLLQGSNSVLATQAMFEYDESLQDYRLANIFNDYNLTGGTNVSIIQNPTTGLYEIVAHDTTYSASNGIDINNANQISVKVDNSSIVINSNGELEATAQTPDLSNYVDKTTAQTISGPKTISHENTFTFASSASSGNATLSNSYGTFTIDVHSQGTFNVKRNGSSCFRSIEGSMPSNISGYSNGIGIEIANGGQRAYGVKIIGCAGTSYPYGGNYIDLTGGGSASMNYIGTYGHPRTKLKAIDASSSSATAKYFLFDDSITSTGNTIAITKNNGVLNLEATASGAQIDDTTVRTDACYSSDKTVDFVTGAIQDALDTVGDEFVAKTDIATNAVAGIVKPDGSTITVAADGTISAAGGGGSSYSSGLGININANNEISVKNDRSNGIAFNSNGELTVACDQTTIGINSLGNLEVISAPAPSNMVTTNTQQTITARKTFTGDILQQSTTYFGDTTTSSNYCGRISLNGSNYKNIAICGGGSYGSEKGILKVGYEAAGSYGDMQGVFITSTPSTSSSYTSEIGLKLGSSGSRCSIAGQGGQIKLTANALNPNKNYLKVANNSLTYVDNSGTSHDLLASGSSSGVQKIAETNPALTPNASNQCVWSITNSLNTNEVIVQIYEVSTGVQITNADIYATSSTVTILLPSTVNISAGTYRVVIIG